MSEETFTVIQYFRDDTGEERIEDLPAKEAVELAKRLTESLGGRLGTTRRIIITDSGDLTVFKWEFGEGVVFPSRDDLIEGGFLR